MNANQIADTISIVSAIGSSVRFARAAIRTVSAKRDGRQNGESAMVDASDDTEQATA